MRSKTRISLALPPTLLLVVGIALAAGTPSVEWKVTGPGGEHLEQGIYSLDNTLGQPVVGPIDTGSIEICAGFMCAVDTMAPATIADLDAATGGAPGTVDLTWTAPGDDGSIGTASTYVVRYHTEQITADNWEVSTNVSGEPPPRPAGSVESMTVSGLPGGVGLWFAIRTRDEVPNTSAVSNSDHAVTDFYASYLPSVLRDYGVLANGGFENGWTGWAHGGALAQAITTNDIRSGSSAARLGDPSYACRGGVPMGSAWMEQTVTVPSSGVSTLRFHYRNLSEDKFAGAGFDRFQILVNGEAVMMDGNRTAVYNCDNPPQSEGWEAFDLDVMPYAGQNITLRLENWNDVDRWYNTWTYVDDIEFLP